MTSQHGVDPSGGTHQMEMGLQPGIGQRTSDATHHIDHGQTPVTLLHFQADTYKALAETLTFLVTQCNNRWLATGCDYRITANY